MAVLPIVLVPDPVLRKKARPVQKVNAAIRKLLDDMAETMYAAPGVGLAAPQVGISKRVIVVDAQDGRGLLQLINPEIVEAAEFGVRGTEGCLSIPGYVGEVDRYRRVKVTALDRHGRRIWIDAADWPARVLQHEIDHLDGILYTDQALNVREVPSEPPDDDAGEVEPDATGVERDAASARAGDGPGGAAGAGQAGDGGQGG